MGENEISGIIPESIGNISYLCRLRLAKNQISGSIPDSIRNLIYCERLELNNNHISGIIPESIGELLRLTNVSFADNNFTGSIPDSFRRLQHHNIDLSNNCFLDWNFETGPNWKMESYNKANPRAKSAMKIATTGKRPPFDGEKPKEKNVKLTESQRLSGNNLSSSKPSPMFWR